jgi:hypothetical protein
MSIDRGDAELRRYLLGELTDEECAALEQDYFSRQDALDRMSAAESDLIDDYVSNELGVPERERFESHYLLAPGHRARVGVAQQLRTAARSHPPAASGVPAGPSWRRAVEAITLLPRTWTAAIAAAVVLVAAAGGWIAISRLPVSGAMTSGGRTQRRTGPDRSTRTSERDAHASAPAVIAISLSPATVRGPDQSVPLTIAAGVERVQIVLEGDGEGSNAATRAVIRKVAGDQVWRGAAAGVAAPAELARLDVPASVLPPDDYIIELYGYDATGHESERARYVLRVRAP